MVLFFCARFYLLLPPSPDQFLFNYYAWQGLHGVPWYAGSFDITWPGALWIAELGIRLFGIHVWTARAIDILLMQGAVAGIFLFLRSAGLTKAAIFAAIAYPIIYVTSGGWMAGHRDIVAMHFLIIASVILLVNSNRSRNLLFAGLFVGYAVLMRPTYLLFGPLAMSIWLISHQNGMRNAVLSLGLFGFGLVSIPSAFFLIGLYSGATYGWLESCRFVFSIYEDHTSHLLMLPKLIAFLRENVLWLFAAGIVGIFFWHSGRHAAFLLSMTLTGLISFLAQNKGFGYHLGGLIPILLIFSFGAVERGISSPLQSSRMTALLIAVTLSWGTLSRVKHNFFRAVPLQSEAQRLGDIAKRESAPDEKIFQWGWNFDFLMAAQRLSATRFTATPILSSIPEGSSFSEWLQRFKFDISSNRLKFVLVDLTTVPSNDSLSPALKILQTELANNYRTREQTPHAILYQRMERGE